MTWGRMLENTLKSNSKGISTEFDVWIAIRHCQGQVEVGIPDSPHSETWLGMTQKSTRYRPNLRKIA